MYRTALLILLVLFLAVAPVAAQDDPDPAVNRVPATFDSLIRVDLSSLPDGSTALDSLNLAMFIASRIQPARISFTQRLTYSNFFPLDILDTENVTFEQNVLPWLDGSIVLAYRNFGPRMNVADGDLLMVLPTSDTFAAADFMSVIVKAQDFSKHETYHEASLYVGDRATIGLTPGAVLIGSEADVKASIDAEAGRAPRLVDTPAYKAVSAALPPGDFVHAYVDGDQALRAVSVLLNGNDSAMSLLTALGGALKSAQATTLESQLLTGAVRGIGFSLSANNLNRTLHAHAAIDADTKPATTPFDPTVLQVLPRSAMFVQSGADAQAALADALRIIPLSSFVPDVLGGFIPRSQNGSTPSPVPSEADLQASVDGFVGTLKTIRKFDINADLNNHIGGSYALALIPRPNNPSPVTGTPYDVLIAAHVANGDAAVKGATMLAQVALGIPATNFQTTQIDGVSFNSAVVKATGDTYFSVGAVDNLLLAGTGDAVAEAMHARQGDNQLIKVDRWLNVVGDSPLLYADLNAIYNVISPAAGGSGASALGQVGINVRDAGNGITTFDVIANVPM